jgi:Xaa-Pro aminopeptidase
LLACAELLQQIGFESAAVSVDQFQTWTRANANVTWVATKDVVESIRIVKDESEVSAIRAAAALADSGFDYLCGVLKPGMTEREAAWELEVYLRTHGVEALAFETIVASGPNGAMAHHRAGDRVIQHGEPIVVDFGCVVDGYCSDMTRTISLGRADAKYDEVYEVVRRAQQSALDGVHAGSTGIEADALARESIGAAGYGDYFGHGLGHGVGLAIHEAPRASKLAKEALPAGATLTIEPGVYLPGWGGVRIEDLVVVRDDGVEILSQAHKRSII